MKSFIFKYVLNKFWAIAISLFILVMCTLPSKAFLENSLISDKIMHVAAFMALSFLWFYQVKFGYKLLIYCVLYGLFIEIWQWALPESFHRGFEWLDLLADAIGSVIGYSLAYFFQKFIFKNG